MANRCKRLRTGEEQQKPVKPVAYSQLLKDHEEKNKALMVSAFKCCDDYHVLFCQIYFVDLLAEYAKEYYPPYSKMPKKFRRLSGSRLLAQLMGRPEHWRFNDIHRRTRARGPSNFWDALPSIMKQIRTGQLGFFRKKSNNSSQGPAEEGHPFVVVWKHPEAASAVEPVPIIGLIFPATVKLDHIGGGLGGSWFWRPPKKETAIVYGGDLSQLSSTAEFKQTWTRVTTRYCNCGVTTLNQHMRTCPVWRSFVEESKWFLLQPSYRLPPHDQYYKVHYFGLWAEAPNQMGAELNYQVFSRRIRVYDTAHPFEMEFVDDIKFWPEIWEPNLQDLTHHTLNLLPFKLDPYSIPLWPI